MIDILPADAPVIFAERAPPLRKDDSAFVYRLDMWIIGPGERAVLVTRMDEIVACKPVRH